MVEGSTKGGSFEGEWRAVEGSRYFQSPYLYKENGFKKREHAEQLISEVSVSKPLSCIVEKIEREKAERYEQIKKERGWA
jgi:DNA topoisomerase-3